MQMEFGVRLSPQTHNVYRNKNMSRMGCLLAKMNKMKINKLCNWEEFILIKLKNGIIIIILA
jgi:hypothetical protein